MPSSGNKVKAGGTLSKSSMICDASVVNPQASTAVYTTSKVPAQLPLSWPTMATETESSKQLSDATMNPAARASSPLNPSNQSAQANVTTGSPDKDGAVLSCTSMVCVPDVEVEFPVQSTPTKVQVRSSDAEPPWAPAPLLHTSIS